MRRNNEGCHLGYGSKHGSRLIDQSTSASTLTLQRPQGRSKFETAGPQTDPASTEKRHGPGDRYPRSKRDALGVPSWVMKRSEAKWSLNRSTLDPVVETIRTATMGANRLPDLRAQRREMGCTVNCLGEHTKEKREKGLSWGMGYGYIG
ncbi:hypothetical protein F5Y12DRAFT_715147 [Xylaria sp. FL1777]|nr:hypothetical protein F5Y12DRAFT_715147 [Xylaria sp. FL1777]